MKEFVHHSIKYLLVVTLLLTFSRVPAQWMQKADALKQRSELGETIVYNSKLYVFGGFSDSKYYLEGSAEVYDPATNKWTAIAALPAGAAMTHQDVVLIDNTVWHIGGRVGANHNIMSSAIWIYNLTNNSWSKGPEIKDPATGKSLVIAASGSVLLGRILHIFGGFTPTSCNDDQDKYHLTLDVDTWLSRPSLAAQWENKLKPLPLKRNHLSALTLGGKIYAIGGQSGHDCGGGHDVSYCHVYDPSTDSWKQLPSLPTGRSHAEGSTFAIDGKIYMVGGQGSDGKSSRYVTIFDPAANNGGGTWTENSSLKLPFVYQGCSAAIIGTTFILSHGSQGASKYPLKKTYTCKVVRNTVSKLDFPSGCLNLKQLSGSSVKGHTWLFTHEGTKNYTTSSNADWLTVSKNATGSANPNALDIEITASTTGLTSGTYSGEISAAETGSGANDAAAVLCVSLTVQNNADSLAQYNLSVTANGDGTVANIPNQTVYNSGTTVILTATPAAGQQFIGWTGSATGTTNPLTITIDANKTITANFQASVSSDLITNLAKNSAKKYSIAQLKAGESFYTDRAYQVTSVPALINLAPFIKTPNDDNSSQVSSLIQFNLTQNATIYIGYDPRATSLPLWLSGWQKNTATLGIKDNALDHLDLYSKDYPAGPVTLGGNMASPAAGAKNNYIVIAVAQAVQFSLRISGVWH